MSTFVQITPDPFSMGRKQITGATDPKFETNSSNSQYDQVRRPVRGIQVKQDTYATIEVKTKDGKNLLLVDSGGGIEKGQFSYTLKNSNFLIQNVQESRAEKYQLIKTFGDTYIFFFGEEPRVHNVTGILFNTADFNWAAEFWENYDKYLRGTQCVTNGTRVQLSYDDIVIQGYILTAQATYVDDPPEYIPFSFQIIVSDYINTSSIGSNVFPLETVTEIFPDSVMQKTKTDPEPVDPKTVEPGGSSLVSKLASVLGKAADVGLQAFALGSTLYNAISGYMSGQKDFIADVDPTKGGALVGNLAMGATNSPGIYKLMKRPPPYGAAGSAFAFDQDHPVTYTYRTTRDTSTVAQYTFGKIRDNYDEYVLGKSTSPYKEPSVKAIESQYANEADLDKALDEQFKAIGAENPPFEVTDAAMNNEFTTTNIGDKAPNTGLELSDGNSAFGFDSYKDSQIGDRMSRIF